MKFLMAITILVAAWTVLAREEEMDEKTIHQSALSPLAISSNGHFLIREDGTPSSGSLILAGVCLADPLKKSGYTWKIALQRDSM